MGRDVLTYRMERPSEVARYALEFILTTIGFASHETDDSDADIYYGDDNRRTRRGVVIRRNESDVVWDDLLDGRVGASDLGGVVPFDVVRAVVQPAIGEGTETDK